MCAGKLRTVGPIILSFVMLLFAAPAAATLMIDAPDDPLHGTEVGLQDTELGVRTGKLPGKPQGEQAEIDWVNGILGTSYTSLDKEGQVPGYNTTMDDVIAFQLLSGPGYYLVKNARVRVLFENLSEISWGVINLSGIDDDINLGGDDIQISHVSGFGEATTQVPAPGALGLLGAGLLGMFAAIRRRRS